MAEILDWEYARQWEDGEIKCYPGKTLKQVIAYDRSGKSNRSNSWRNHSGETKILKRRVSPTWEEVKY